MPHPSPSRRSAPRSPEPPAPRARGPPTSRRSRGMPRLCMPIPRDPPRGQGLGCLLAEELRADARRASEAEIPIIRRGNSRGAESSTAEWWSTLAPPSREPLPPRAQLGRAGRCDYGGSAVKNRGRPSRGRRARAEAGRDQARYNPSPAPQDAVRPLCRRNRSPERRIAQAAMGRAIRVRLAQVDIGAISPSRATRPSSRGSTIGAGGRAPLRLGRQGRRKPLSRAQDLGREPPGPSSRSSLHSAIDPEARRSSAAAGAPKALAKARCSSRSRATSGICDGNRPRVWARSRACPSRP